MIAQIIDHWVLPDRLEQARALFDENTRAIRKIPGLVARYVMQSKKDPLKWTAFMIWENEAAIRAWGESPEHIWDVHGKTPVIPAGTDYHRRYAGESSVQARPVVAEQFELMPD